MKSAPACNEADPGAVLGWLRPCLSEHIRFELFFFGNLLGTDIPTRNKALQQVSQNKGERQRYRFRTACICMHELASL